MPFNPQVQPKQGEFLAQGIQQAGSSIASALRRREEREREQKKLNDTAKAAETILTKNQELMDAAGLTEPEVKNLSARGKVSLLSQINNAISAQQQQQKLAQQKRQGQRAERRKEFRTQLGEAVKGGRPLSQELVTRTAANTGTLDPKVAQSLAATSGQRVGTTKKLPGGRQFVFTSQSSGQVIEPKKREDKFQLREIKDDDGNVVAFRIGDEIFRRDEFQQAPNQFQPAINAQTGEPIKNTFVTPGGKTVQVTEDIMQQFLRAQLGGGNQLPTTGGASPSGPAEDPLNLGIE